MGVRALNCALHILSQSHILQINEARVVFDTAMVIRSGKSNNPDEIGMNYLEFV